MAEDIKKKKNTTEKTTSEKKSVVTKKSTTKGINKKAGTKVAGTNKRTSTAKKTIGTASKKPSDTAKAKATSIKKSVEIAEVKNVRMPKNATEKKKTASATKTIKKPSTVVKKVTKPSVIKTTPRKVEPVVSENKAQPEQEKIKVIDDLKVKKEESIIIKEERKAPEEVSSILGITLPTGLDKNEKKMRTNLYIKDSIIFAVIIPVLDLFAMFFIDAYKAYPITNNDILNYCITLLIDFILIFVLTFVVDYIHGERLVKRINKKK